MTSSPPMPHCRALARTRVPRRLPPLSALALALLVAGCGGGGGGGGAGPAPVAPPTAQPPTETPPVAPPTVSAGPQVLMQTRLGVDPQAVAAARGVTVVGQFGKRPIYQLQLAVGADVDAVVGALRLDPGVVFAEPNRAKETPEGQHGNSVWAIGASAQQFATQWAPQALRLPQAHAVTTGAGVRVAVLDTGIELSHPAFAGRLARRADGSLLGRDFVDDDADPSEVGSTADAGFGHGTHVAGLVTLAAPSATIMPVRVLDRQGRSNAWVLAEALAWAIDPDGDPNTDDGAHVVNLSLGGTEPTRLLRMAVALAECKFDDDDDDDVSAPDGDDYDHPGFDDDRQRCGVSRGVTVIAAAGNAGNDQERLYPAAEGVDGSVAVTATNAQRRLAGFSNSGDWIDLAAPGELVISAVPGGAWGTWSGTSMAAPLVAGVTALVLTTPAPNPLSGITDPLRQWDPDDIVDRLQVRGVPVCGAFAELREVDAAAAVTDTAPQPPTCG